MGSRKKRGPGGRGYIRGRGGGIPHFPIFTISLHFLSLESPRDFSIKMLRKAGSKTKGSLKKTQLQPIEGTDRYRCPVSVAYGLRAGDVYLGLRHNQRPALVNDLPGHASRIQVHIFNPSIRVRNAQFCRICRFGF